jgi:hypothetical protein
VNLLQFKKNPRIRFLCLFRGFRFYPRTNTRRPASERNAVKIFWEPQKFQNQGNAEFGIFRGSLQVFRLPDRSTCRAFPSVRQWRLAAFVPGYGGGSATDFHRLPLIVFSFLFHFLTRTPFIDLKKR